MARIEAAELERLKRETDLARLVEGSGVELRRHGADLVGRCPFHEDRTPSLVVSPGKNLWHCLGACRAGGSVIDWVMRAERVSFRHAVEILLRGEPARAEGRTPARRQLSECFSAEAADETLLREVVAYYHETLKESAEAVDYLKKRGLDSVEAIDRFQLGYANRTLGYRLPKKVLKAGAEVRGRLQRLGLLRASGHEHLSGSLVVPVIDRAGEVRGMYGRKLGDRLRAGTPDHLYLPGPHRGVWNEAALADSKEIILCEALLDALTFWCAGFRNVTSSYGVAGFTEDHRAVLRKYGTGRVLIAYDHDAAGDRAAAALAEELTHAGIECYRIVFPEGLDANAYALRAQPAAESLAERIRHAVWLGRGRQSPAPVAASAAEPASNGEPSGDHDSGREETSGPLPPLAAEPLALTASPIPAAPPELPAVEEHGRELTLGLGERGYRVRGLEKNVTPDALRVNLLVRQGGAVHVDTLDLYAAKQRALFARQAAQELGTGESLLQKELGQVLLALEAFQDARTDEALAPREAAPEMSEAERSAALALLGAPDLLERVLEAFDVAGVVGEETNKLVAYLAAVSRKLERPLAVIIQSSSAAGKTSLMDAVLGFVPEEERTQYSAMTGQSLFYMGGRDLRHKVLAIVEEEGAERASYALKLLQSEGVLTIASTGKDPHTGRLVTEEYRVEGPVAIMLTTTATDLDEELLNRALVLTVDEARPQTRRVHERQRQRRTLEGLLARERRAGLVALHQNAQRLLRPLAVVNPYAPRLTFLDVSTRTRRDHEKYLTLIDAIALLHQHQREVKHIERADASVEYVEVTLADVAAANRLAGAVLGRSLDELPPQTRRFLEALAAWVEAACAREATPPDRFRFTAREARDALATGPTQTKVHLGRLVELEYVLAHRSGPRCHYELLYRGEGDDDAAFLPGLTRIEDLERHYGPERSADRPERPAAGRASVGPRSAAGRIASEPHEPAPAHRFSSLAAEEEKKHAAGEKPALASYVVAIPAAANGRSAS